ncbi:hypothetical protein L3Y34_011032 [Caenorhabditis briggsae]|uniref:Uncharacterized protein n=1 Tax=Caenorhabditis briggsae TaxID=6238 RepID=A0AAE8ZQS6_CAEBR|nr:hypothetical protein L3Y34_011032 [Caenorhabditis briggsae]
MDPRFGQSTYEKATKERPPGSLATWIWDRFSQRDQKADPMEQMDQDVHVLHGPGPATLQLRNRNLPDPIEED